MDMELSGEELAFRDEVRSFLEEKLTEDLRAGARATPTVFAEPDISQRWQKILYEKGWLGYNWPAEYGGTGWGPTRRYIFERECAMADAPDLPVLSLKLLAPVVQNFGTQAQKDELLPRILSGADYWCQGFSEPQAGSDLARLKTRAVQDGDRYVINGSKLWTTHAQHANRIFCLVRTDAEVKPQAGLTFVLVDLDQPGIKVEPIIGLAGDHEVNAVFFDDAVAPVSDRIGDEGQGWTIAKFLLENERGGSCHAPKLVNELIRLRLLAGEKRNAAGTLLIDDALFAHRLARLEFEAQALDMTELRILDELARGQRPGPQTSLVKMAASSLRQEIDTLCMTAHGYDALQLTRARPLYDDGCDRPVASKAAQVAPASYLNNRAWTIFGGSNEVQKNIIAKTVLGL